MVRAKFVVVKKEAWTLGGGEVVLAPVCSEDPNHENKKFWDATPSGSCWMGINNPAAFDQFEKDAEYYVDFTKA